MPLIDLKTDLKSLNYGDDRAGGGSSREPFITSDIPDELPNNSIDVILRDGSLVRGAQDVSRLTQLFTTPKGLKFITNTNLLSRTSVKTEATKGPAYAGGTINQGIYTPVSTLAQAAIAYSGTHLNLLGLDPSSPIAGVVEGGLFPGGGLIRYEQVVKKENRASFLGNSRRNRLVSLYDTKILGNFLPENSLVALDEGNILSYSGGPGAILGIGKTIIKRSTYTTGRSEYGFIIKDFLNSSAAGVSSAKTYFNNNYSTSLKITDSFTDPNEKNELPGISSGSYNKNFPRGVVSNNEIVTLKTAYKKPDGNELGYVTSNQTRTYKANPNFIRSRYGNLALPTSGSKQYTYTGDKFNATNTNKLNTSLKTNVAPVDDQLFKFYLNLVNPQDPTVSNYIYWQAYVDNFSDSVNSNYDSFVYTGRGYPSYRYKGFTRAISLDFTIVAERPGQIIPIYTKLNTLIQNLAPNYGNSGYIRGNFARLTFGDYLDNVPGIINGFTINPIFEAGFDTGISAADGTALTSTSDLLSALGDNNINQATVDQAKTSSGKQLPKAIKISGFNFTPVTSNDNRLVSDESQFISY